MSIGKIERKIIKLINEQIVTWQDIFSGDLNRVLKSRSYRDIYYLKRTFKRLEEEGIIFFAGEKIKLSKQGKDLLGKIEVNELTINRENSWDGVWRLVSYDIPETKKKERDYFRSKLTGFGFKQIQHSLWAFPWDCKEEIAILCQNLGISPFVAYLKTNQLPLQLKLIKHFGLEDYL